MGRVRRAHSGTMKLIAVGPQFYVCNFLTILNLTEKDGSYSNRMHSRNRRKVSITIEWTSWVNLQLPEIVFTESSLGVYLVWLDSAL